MYRPAANSFHNPRPPFVPFQRNPNGRGRWPRFGLQQNYGRPHIQNTSEENWCETCDRGFPNAGILEKHKQEHRKCNIDGCEFIAHPKVITKHIQMQHSSGLFKKIANLKNPEDIQKWREERKRRFPTKENVDRKAAELKEKIERGEKMGLQNERRNRKTGEPQKRSHSMGNENVDNRKRNKPNHFNNNNKKKKMPAKVEKDLPLLDDKRKLKPFGGIQDLIAESDVEDHNEPEQCDFLIEDDEDYSTQKIIKPQTCETSKPVEPSVCGALSSLICEYGSSDEELETCQGPPPINTIPAKAVQNRQKNIPIEKCPTVINPQNQPNKDQDSDDSGPEETSITKKPEQQTHEPPESTINCKDNGKKTKSSSNHQTRQSMVKRPKKKLPSTLLQKLLHQEIQHERNIVLQCIRHIVKHNFFDP